MKHVKVVSFLLILALLATLVACGGAAQPAPEEQPAAEEPAAEEAAAEEPAAEADKVFKIGVLGPFTGPSARTGEEFKASAEMALENIDYQIGDYTLEPVWIDSQSDPEKATRAYEEAVVQDGVEAGAINWHSSVAVAVMEVTAKHQVPHFFGFGATEVVNEKFESDPEKFGYWTSKGWPTPVKLSKNYVTAVEDAIAAGQWSPESKTAAIYGEDTDWGRSFGNGIKSQLQEAGWEILDEQYFPIEQTEFYPLLNKFRDLNVSLIAGTSTAPPSLSAFIKQADEVGLESLIIADGLGWVGEWYELTGDSSNYVVDQIPGFTTEAARAFAEEFEARSGIQPSPSSGGLSYDGMNFFIKVLQTTYDDFGELSSANVYETVKNKVWTGELVFTAEDGAIVMQEYNFSEPPDPIVGKGYYTFPVLQYFDGESRVVWPDEWAVTTLTPPGEEPAAVTEPAAAAEEEMAEEEPMAEEEATELLKIGVLGPFTGPSARTGEEFQVSAEMALENIGYQIGKYQIEPVWVDSQSDPEKATRAYEEAVVQDGIQAGVINWHSSVSVAVMEVTAKHQVPHFFGFGATEVVNEKFESDPDKYGYWTSKGWPTPVKLSKNYVTALEDAIEAGTWSPESKTAAIYGEDTDWGRSFGNGIKSQLEEAGWEILDEQYFPIEQTEFYPLLNKFKDLNVSLIAGTSTAPPSLSAFIKQADEVGVEALIIADGLGWVGEWYELTGDSSNYVVDQIPGWTTEEAQSFAEAFEAKSGIQPSPSSGGLSYDGMNFFIKVLQTTYEDFGELTNETIFETVQNKVWTGELTFSAEDGAIVMQEYDFSDPPDPIVGKGYYTFPVLQYMDGEGQVIWPDEWKETDIQAPQ